MTVARPAPMRSAATRLAGLLVLAGVLTGFTAAPVAAAPPFVMDLYFSSGYERQVDNRTCTAASVAMMLNFIARRDLGLDQMAILRYEQPRDALSDAVQRGSDPLGWSRALTYYSSRTGRSFVYDWEAHATEAGALRRAAQRIAVTGRPVGLTISGGRHAVVMTGFEASADPRLGAFTLTHVWISDPYGARHTRYTVSGSPLDPYRELDATPTYDQAWYGKHVIVVPRPDAGPLPVGGAVVSR